jgi:hypothetical protein
VRPLPGQTYYVAANEDGFTSDASEDPGPVVKGAEDLIDAFENLLDKLF